MILKVLVSLFSSFPRFFLGGSRKVPASVVTFRPVKVTVYLLKLGHPEIGPFTAANLTETLFVKGFALVGNEFNIKSINLYPYNSWTSSELDVQPTIRDHLNMTDQRTLC